MGNVYIPRMVKHVAMAVWRKKATPNFPEALLLARHHLTKHGYLAAGSEHGPVSNIKVTSKGRKREREHLRKPMRTMREFDQLYSKHGMAEVVGKVERDSPEDPKGGRK